MREIREVIFRGKRTDNGDWHEGEDIMRNTIRGKVCLAKIGEDWISVDPETVGQYTGLTDKNGVRIFEGDIVSLVKHDSLIYKVVYVPCRYELVNSKGVNCFVLDIYKSENIEVIGNIHDNPELLGGENNGINR